MIKMLVDVQQGNVPATFVNPMFVNVRAFRVSRLYGSQCESLIGCFTSVGLQDLIVSFNFVILNLYLVKL